MPHGGLEVAVGRVDGEVHRSLQRAPALRGPEGIREDPLHLLGGVGAVGGMALEIHLSGGDRIVFPQGGSLGVLRAVVELLRERC